MGKLEGLLLVVGVLCLPQTSHSQTLSEWLPLQESQSQSRIFANISPAGTSPGAVIASPSRDNPNYYYHWVRDAALTMDAVVQLYLKSSDQNERQQLLQKLEAYADFSRENQLTPNRSGGLGEPKFNVDGSAFSGDWGRPQDDGPALRALTLMHYIGALSASQVENMSAFAVIENDLDYVANHWRETCYDLWEETHGHHFYTEMVERRALIEGAAFAAKFGDSANSLRFNSEVNQLNAELLRHWDPERGYVTVTLDNDGGNNYKTSGLDVSVILAALHGDAGDSFFNSSDERILATALKINQAFASLYVINTRGNVGVAPAIGRYPEDRYSGDDSGGPANPWVLATNAFAEIYYKAAKAFQRAGQIQITAINHDFFQALGFISQSELDGLPLLKSGTAPFSAAVAALNATGDLYLSRTKLHTPAEGELSEEMDRATGFMHGAADLTWSHVSLLTAAWARPTLDR